MYEYKSIEKAFDSKRFWFFKGRDVNNKNRTVSKT